MKKINLMPIAAAVFGLVLVFSQSAFKSESKQNDYLFAKQSNGVWINITGQTNYTCDSEENFCTVIASEQPIKGSEPTDARRGNYTPLQ